MTLTIDLSHEAESRLVEEAARHGLQPPEYARRLIEKLLSALNGASLPQHDSSPGVGPSPLGQRLREIRARIVTSGEPLLDWEGVAREKAAMRRGREPTMVQCRQKERKGQRL